MGTDVDVRDAMRHRRDAPPGSEVDDPRPRMRPNIAKCRPLLEVPGTGSTEVGRLVLGAAAQCILRCSHEVGGNAPFVILAGSDVAAGAVHAKLRHSAQTLHGRRSLLRPRLGG